jgi:uncharacterized protein YbbC (DUF1343 family)
MPSLPVFTLLLFAFAALFPLNALAKVELGIDVLENDDFAALKGKRIGLITNQTSFNSRGILTRKLLHDAKNVQLVTLFAPEHGLDGSLAAGQHIQHFVDPMTGLKIYSLYGPTRKPRPEMMEGIDTFVFDLQDIGSRSYTYISTMFECMNVAGRNKIEFIVLDRPNPLGGVRVEGPPIEKRWLSFVGRIPVAYRHGMTTGELAQMINAKKWIKYRPKLTVVKMRGWERTMTWDQTGFPWVAASPNVPLSTTPFYYTAVGLAGSLKGIDVGAGTLRPLEYVASEHLHAALLTLRMSSLGLPGVTFTPYIQGKLQGVKVEIKPHYDVPLCAINVHLLSAAQKATPGGLFNLPRSHYEVIYKCFGSDSIKLAFESSASPHEIIATWSLFNSRFEEERKPFLLY